MRPSVFARRVLVVVLAIAAGATIAVQARGGGATLAPTPLPLPQQGTRVQFAQLNWLDDTGSPLVPHSHAGVAAFSFTGSELQLLEQNGGGYVNLVTDAGTGPRWSIENLHLTYPDENYMMASHPTVQFDLGVQDGMPLNLIGWTLAITPQPLPTQPDQPLVFSPVESDDYLVGGLDGGGSGDLSVLAGIGPFVGCHYSACVAPLVLGVMPIPVSGVPAVDEDSMGCVPGALARSLKYMFGGGALANVDVQDIYRELYGLLGTNQNNPGTSSDSIKQAKRTFAKNHDLKVNTTAPNFKNGVRNGPTDLRNGVDLEIRIDWGGGRGHMGMVTSIEGDKDSGYTIKYVDDPKQGDHTSANEEHVIKVDKDGNITAGGKGKVTGFVREEKTK